jgi:hypothetical protein
VALAITPSADATEIVGKPMQASAQASGNCISSKLLIDSKQLHYRTGKRGLQWSLRQIEQRFAGH